MTQSSKDGTPAFNRIPSIGALAVALYLFSLCFGAFSASADITLCPVGLGVGQCSEPQGIAVDFETEHIYVADKGHNKVEVFEPDGSFLFAISLPSLPLWVAVDNGAISPSHHDLYVALGHEVRKFTAAGTEITGAHLPFGTQGKGNGQLEELKGIGVTGDGTIYVADQFDEGGAGCGVTGLDPKAVKRVQKFNEAGELESGKTVTIPSCAIIRSFAADSTGAFYIGTGAREGTQQQLIKYAPGGTEVYVHEVGVPEQGLAVDSADNLLAVQGEIVPVGSFLVVARYTPAGTILRRFGYDAIKKNSVTGFGVLHSSFGVALVSENNGATQYISEPPPGPVGVPSSLEAREITSTKARLRAALNPEGKATTYHFEYITEAEYKANGNTFAGAKMTSPASLGAEDFNLHVAGPILVGCLDPVSEAAKCLTPETKYRSRLVASNADGEGNSKAPLEGSFATTVPFESRVFASEVSTDAARLGAEVNPLGIEATGHFQYIAQSAFEANLAAGHEGFEGASRAPVSGELDFGAGEAFATRSTSVELSPGTAYRYRVVVGDLLVTSTPGAEGMLRTFAAAGGAAPCPANEAFRTAGSALLPDCRAYEMVSPLQKESGDVIALRAVDPTDAPAVLNQSATSGDKLAYGSYRAFGDAASAPYTSQYIATRTERGQAGEGWSSEGISPPRERLTLQVAGALENELKIMTPDLCQSWWRTFAEPKLAPGAVEGLPNLYRRRGAGCGAPAWEALTTVPLLHGKSAVGVLVAQEVQGVAADGSAAAYVASDNLETQGIQPPNLDGKQLSLYYQAEGEGKPSYVCVLPNGAASPSPCTAGYLPTDLKPEGRNGTLQGALSQDGQRVFWTAYKGGGGPGQIYLRENPAEPQSPISGGKCAKPTRGCTIAVSAKGEETSGATSSQFIAAAADGSAALYKTETAEGKGGDLYRFTVEGEQTKPIAHKVRGIAASPDLSHIYLVSEEALSGPNAQGLSPQAGKPNLYLYEEGSPGSFEFITEAYLGLNLTRPFNRTYRLSPSGEQLAFTSESSQLAEEVAAYDNHDAATGQSDAEVYLYDAGAEGGKGRTLCISCNPTGGRPVGAHEEILNPIFTRYAAVIPPWESSLYAPRALSADGKRLYFNAADALSPRDSNGATDVYQWEVPGTGSCEESSSDYYASNGGCITLVSSGQSSAGSQFTDASPGGQDVFFATLSSLVSQDYGLVDLYDARVDGGFPAPPTPAASCEGEACQGPYQAPQDITPASAGLQGAGNIKEPSKAKKQKKAHKKKRRARHRKHSRQANHHRRAAR